METKKSCPLSAHELRACSAVAFVDPRTLKKALAGQPVRPMVWERIVSALSARGLSHLIKPPLAVPKVDGR